MAWELLTRAGLSFATNDTKHRVESEGHRTPEPWGIAAMGPRSLGATEGLQSAALMLPEMVNSGLWEPSHPLLRPLAAGKTCFGSLSSTLHFIDAVLWSGHIWRDSWRGGSWRDQDTLMLSLPFFLGVPSIITYRQEEIPTGLSF